MATQFDQPAYGTLESMGVEGSPSERARFLLIAGSDDQRVKHQVQALGGTQSSAAAGVGKAA